MLSFDKVIESTHNGVFLQQLYTEYKGYKILFAYDSPIAMASLTFLDPNEPMIFVSADFIKSSELLQEFLLEHEIGHIQCNHLILDKNLDEMIPSVEEGQERMNEYFKKRSQSLDVRELEADKYAVEVLGVYHVLEALKELRVYADILYKRFIAQVGYAFDNETQEQKFQLQYAMKEIDERIKHIEIVSLINK